jgi:hypothetical protein
MIKKQLLVILFISILSPIVINSTANIPPPPTPINVSMIDTEQSVIFLINLENVSFSIELVDLDIIQKNTNNYFLKDVKYLREINLSLTFNITLDLEEIFKHWEKTSEETNILVILIAFTYIDEYDHWNSESLNSHFWEFEVKPPQITRKDNFVERIFLGIIITILIGFFLIKRKYSV